MVRLEHAYGIAVRLLLDAQREATSALADSFRNFQFLTDGPDAESSPEGAERLKEQAEALDRMTFQVRVCPGQPPLACCPTTLMALRTIVMPKTTMG